MPANIEQAPIIFAILGLAFLAQALKETGIPSPGLSQSLLIYAGYQIARGGIFLGTGIILFTFAGSLYGAYLIYCLARFGGTKLLAKIKRYTRFSPESMEKAGNMIKRHSSITVALGRSIPGMMVPTSIAAGTLKMPVGKFLLGIVIPLTLWMAVMAGMGSGIRNFTPQINLSPNQMLLPLGVLIAAGVLAGILSVRRRRTPKSAEVRKTEVGDFGVR
jgi:membrane protein DedA with SNARE-associated domain